jgi:hypothetical protein
LISKVVVQFEKSVVKVELHRRDAENTEGAQRKAFNSLRYLRELCVSAVKLTITYSQP